MASSECTNVDKLKEGPSVIPEDIGVAEDSGFASIAETATAEISDCQNQDDTLSHDNNVTSSEVLLENAETTQKRRRTNARFEAKREAEAEYNREKKEKTYRRLMHLLNKSKFYSDRIIEKINQPTGRKESETRVSSEKRNEKKDSTENDPPPLKRSKRIAKANKKKNMGEFITGDIRKKIQRKMNLSQDEIAEELNTESDSDEPQSAANSAYVKPKYLQGTLWEYQEDGLQWLKVLYENGLNGILADEMGLGKTIQVIALLCHLIEKEQAGPYLIIVPLSTLPNWLIEFEKFSSALPVVMMHGTKEERAEIAKKINLKYPVGGHGFKTYPIVLTTYETPIRERSLEHMRWRYIILDEGHRIKNPKCQLLRVLHSYKSMNRLILTGTPLQNDLKELWSLLHFLQPDIFHDLDVFESWFDAKQLQDEEGTAQFLKQEQEKQVMLSLREILKPFMLRREKKDVNLMIPPKKEMIVYAPLTQLQRDLYAATLNRDLYILTKTNTESLILDDETGIRPKRKCLSRHKHSSIYRDPYDTSLCQSWASTDTLSENNDTRNSGKTPESSTNLHNIPSDSNHLLEKWKPHGNVTDDNCNYFIRLTMTNTMRMYIKILNHPYLIHCPLGEDGSTRIDENLVKVSGKLQTLDVMLKKLHAGGHKVLLFSTMTMILDIIEDYLCLRPWAYVRLDGKYNMEDRKQNISSFNNDPNIFLFLISTRAGGIGLNLTAADTVIMYDSDWNPQADLQAMARCHRIGQTRPVVIYRLCAKGSIDEAIMRRAEAKRKLEKMVISKEISFSHNRADTVLELKRLLESSESETVTSGNQVLTEDELDKLMDRSDLVNSNQPSNTRTAGMSNEPTEI